MSMLTLKALRDTLAHKGQFIALIVLVALGITSFVTFQNGYYDLKASLDEAYSRLRFADVTIRVDRAPLAAAREAEKVPGVAAARVRTIQDFGLELADGRRATARIVSVPDEPGANVNDVIVEQGEFPAADARAAVMLHPKFASETGLGVGDSLTLRVGGEREVVRVTGIASDPEYMYPLRSGGDLPSPGEFAVLFVPEHVVEDLLGQARLWQRLRGASRAGHRHRPARRRSRGRAAALRRRRFGDAPRPAGIRRAHVRAEPEPDHGALAAGTGLGDQLDVAVHRAVSARDRPAR